MATAEVTWHDLAPQWDAAAAVALEIDTFRWRSHSHRIRTQVPDARLLGVLGEITYAIETGQPWTNRALNPAGDGGQDFPDGTNVTSTWYKRDPRLLVDVRTKVIAERYALAVVHRDGMAGSIVLTASREEVLQFDREDVGYGPAYSRQVHGVEPPGLLSGVLYTTPPAEPKPRKGITKPRKTALSLEDVF